MLNLIIHFGVLMIYIECGTIEQILTSLKITIAFAKQNNINTLDYILLYDKILLSKED